RSGGQEVPKQNGDEYYTLRTHLERLLRRDAKGNLLFWCRFVRVYDHAARIRFRTGQPQRLPVLENPQPAPDRDRVHEDVELVDQIVFDQFAHKRGPTIHDDVLAALSLQLVHRLKQVAGFHPHILSLDTLQRLAEHDFRRVHHLAREAVFGAVRLHGLPVLDEAVGHLSTEQDGVARVGDLDDAGNNALVQVARHPIELAFRPRDEPVDGHLHLQL